MSDVSVPSYRIRPTQEGPAWRLLAFAGGVVATLAVVGAAVWGLSGTGPRGVPVIEADPRPFKVKPDNPGGLRVANQDEWIYDRDRRQSSLPESGVRLAPEPEAPRLDALRRQVAPPPAPAPVPETQWGEPAAEVALAAAPSEESEGDRVQSRDVATAAATSPGLAPVPNGRIQVQLGALPSEEGARAEWERLSRRVPELAAFEPRFIRFDREGQPTMWRIRTGAFADTPAAEDMCGRVRARGGACAVLGG